MAILAADAVHTIGPVMHILLRGDLAQRLRLISGLVLFAFALTHFFNHALGLISLDAMTAMQEWRTWFTRSPLGSVVLAAALLTHMGLALYKLACRATLRLPPWELAQIGLGLAIPVLLIPHLVDTRLARMLFDVNDVYLYELLRLWPEPALEQTILLLLVWVHGCMGLHFWLRLTDWYRRCVTVLFAVAVLLPFASLAGFMVSARDARNAIADPDIAAAVKELTRWPSPEANQALVAFAQQGRIGFYLLLAGIAAAMTMRWLARRFKPDFAVSYVPEPTVRARMGASLLEISRMHRIPHLSVCGGRARCSTCRVEVLRGLDLLPPPNQAEAQTLASIRAPPGVRLACQLRPTGPLAVKLILRPGRTQLAAGAEAQGTERVLAVLFLDVRGFTGLSEHKLPYDVVFVLNRLFAATGAAVTANGGWIDKYLGDGLMAVFGREAGAEEGCRQALHAARAIDLALDEVNAEVVAEIGAPLRVGIGIHVGPLVLGRIGHGQSAPMTVIGSTVNAASRLEALTKELDCQLVVSVEAARMAGLPLESYTPRHVSVRGLAQPLAVIAVGRARDLPALPATVGVPSRPDAAGSAR